jgi:hypothetical protein
VPEHGLSVPPRPPRTRAPADLLETRIIGDTKRFLIVRATLVGRRPSNDCILWSSAIGWRRPLSQADRFPKLEPQTANLRRKPVRSLSTQLESKLVIKTYPSYGDCKNASHWREIP